MRAWDPESRILAIDRSRARESTGMSCQPIAGYEREMFSAGCTMNIGSKKLLREVASTFCGAQVVLVKSARTIVSVALSACALRPFSHQKPPTASPRTKTTAPARATHRDQAGCTAVSDNATAVRPDSVSRLRRCKSARIPAAPW